MLDSTRARDDDSGVGGDGPYDNDMASVPLPDKRVKGVISITGVAMLTIYLLYVVCTDWLHRSWGAHLSQPE